MLKSLGEKKKGIFSLPEKTFKKKITDKNLIPHQNRLLLTPPSIPQMPVTQTCEVSHFFFFFFRDPLQVYALQGRSKNPLLGANSESVILSFR